MRASFVEWLICAICLGCSSGCDLPEDGRSGGDINGDLTIYEDDVRAVLEHTFSGTVEDGDHEIPCRFDGQAFEFYLQLASPMSCEDSEGTPADCTNAATGTWSLEGELEIDAAYQLTGSASIFDLEILHASLTTDIPSHENSFGDGKLDELHFDSEITQIDIAIQNDALNTSEWEICWLNVDTIE